MDFKDIYQRSISKPEEFWKEISNDIFWFKKPNKILNKNGESWSTSKSKIEIRIGEDEENIKRGVRNKKIIK